jgi:hypothetical protein
VLPSSGELLSQIFSANESLHVATLTLLAQHMYDCYLIGATKRMHQEKKTQGILKEKCWSKPGYYV